MGGLQVIQVKVALTSHVPSPCAPPKITVTPVKTPDRFQERDGYETPTQFSPTCQGHGNKESLGSCPSQEEPGTQVD